MKQVKKDEISSRLKDIRLNARLTQKEMAVIIGLSSGAVGAIENGLYTPNFDVLRRIHKQLNVSYDYVIDGVTDSVNIAHLVEENNELKGEVDRLKKMVDRLLK